MVSDMFRISGNECLFDDRHVRLLIEHGRRCLSYDKSASRCSLPVHLIPYISGGVNSALPTHLMCLLLMPFLKASVLEWEDSRVSRIFVIVVVVIIIVSDHGVLQFEFCGCCWLPSLSLPSLLSLL